ncbi:MAG: hypothetical protein AB1896_01150 [Thermodesulfobacteriota bacterium]
MTDTTKMAEAPPNQYLTPDAKAVLEELKNLLQGIYADLVVPRDKVKAVAQRGRRLAAETDSWPGGAEKGQVFLETVDGLEDKIYRTLDLKRLREEGLVRAVKF